MRKEEKKEKEGGGEASRRDAIDADFSTLISVKILRW